MKASHLVITTLLAFPTAIECHHETHTKNADKADDAQELFSAMSSSGGFHRRAAEKDSSSASFSFTFSLDSSGVSDETSSPELTPPPSSHSSSSLFSSKAPAEALSTEHMPLIPPQESRSSSSLFSGEQSPAGPNLVYSDSTKHFKGSAEIISDTTRLFAIILLAVSVCGIILLIAFLRTMARRYAKEDGNRSLHAGKDFHDEEVSTGIPSTISLAGSSDDMGDAATSQHACSPIIDEVEEGILPMRSRPKCSLPSVESKMSVFPLRNARSRLSQVPEESSIDFGCEAWSYRKDGPAGSPNYS